MVIKNFLTGICVLLAFGATESFGAASIRATTVGASGSATGATSARTGSMRLSGTKTVSATPTTESGGTASSSATGARMPVLPGGTPKLGTSPKLPSMTGGVSLDGYATEAWTIENFQPIGDYQPAGNYLTESDLDGYATEDYVDDAIAGLAPHILIQADSNDVIYYCIAAGCESVPVGTEGYWAEFPTDGLAGADGREIELQKTSTYIQWRYKTGTDTTWKNLVKLSDLKGAPGQDGASPTVTVTQSGDTYTMTITNADGTVQTPISWTAGGSGNITVDSALSTTSENPVQNKVVTAALNDKVSKSGYTSADNNKVWQVKKSGNNYVLQLVALSDVTGGGISLDDVADAGYLNDLSGSTYVNAGKDGNTGTVELTNITSSRNDITNTSTKLTRAMDVQSYVVNYVASHGGGSTTIVYNGLVDNVSGLPTNDLTNGATYYVVDSQSFYIWNGTDWDIVPFMEGLATTSDLNNKQPKSDSLSLGNTDGTWSDVKDGTYVSASATTGGTKFDVISNQMAKTAGEIIPSSAKLVQAKAVYAYAQPKGDYVTPDSDIFNNYVAKSGYESGDNGKIWQITKNDQDQYVLSLVNMPAGLNTDELQTYLTENNYVQQAALDNKQNKSNASAGTYKVGYTGDTWATLGATDYVTLDTTTATNPKIALKASRIATSIGDDATTSTKLVTEGAVRGAITAALVGQTPEDLATMIQEAVDGQFQTTSNANFQFGMAEGGWKPVISTKYIQINNSADNAISLIIPDSALIKNDTTIGTDDDLVTLGGMRCVTSKTDYIVPSGECQGTAPAALSGFPCYTKRGATTLSLQNTCLNTGWGTWNQPVQDSCGTIQYGNGYNYQRCSGHREANATQGTQYEAFEYILETVGCSTVYQYVAPGGNITMATAQGNEGDTMWAKLKEISAFNTAVSGGANGYTKIYTAIGRGRTGQKCGGNVEWGTYSDDTPCNRIAESDKYTYDICNVGTNPGTNAGQNNVDGKTTYMLRKTKDQQCQTVNIDYTNPRDIPAAQGQSGNGSETSPYTKRGFTDTNVIDSCQNSSEHTYVFDNCAEFVGYIDNNNSDSNSKQDEIRKCYPGNDETQTPYYWRVAGGNTCALAWVRDDYTGPSGNGGNYVEGNTTYATYKTKGKIVSVYVNPCSGDEQSSAPRFDTCDTVDMGEMDTSGVKSSQGIVQQCTCGGSTEEDGPCKGSITANPKNYYVRGIYKINIKQCHVTTTDYIPASIPNLGNSNSSTNCGGENNPCTVRGYSKTTTTNTCPNSTGFSTQPKVTYAIDTCRAVGTNYTRASNAADWYNAQTATVNTRYLCTKNDNSGDTYYLENGGSGLCGKIWVDITYVGPTSCDGNNLCVTKGKKVMTYLDPCDTDANGVVTVRHQDTQDSCVLEQMEQMEAEEGPALRSGVSTSQFQYECTCGGIDGVCTTSNTTYKWQKGVEYQIKTCSYKIARATSDSGQYQLKKYCSDDDTGEDVGGVCIPTVEYTEPATRVTNDTANICRGSSSKCYEVAGKTTTTPFTDVDGTCQAGTATSVEDTCDVDAELSYSNSNTGNYTYYNCSNGEMTYYLRKQQTPYFKGYEDVGHPADPSNNVSATGVFLTATQAKADANAAVTTANTAAATANTVSLNLDTLTTNVNKLGDALLGTSECRAPREGGTGLGTSSGSETDCSAAVTLTSVLMSYFDSMCSNGNAACTASTSLQQLLQDSTSLPSEKNN